MNGTTTFTHADLATAIPGNVLSQNVSQSVPLEQVLTNAGWLPTTIYQPSGQDAPIFRTETEQLDLLRVAMILVGVFIGMKVLR